MKFLEEVAKDILQKTTNTQSFCVILPNNRSVNYLRYFYAKAVGKTVWLPTFMTIDAFFQSLTNYTTENNLKLIFILYKQFKEIYKNVEYFSDFTLDDFWFLAEIILNDFNEIDNYLIDPQTIYSYLLDYEKINFEEQYIDPDLQNYIKKFFSYKGSAIRENFISLIERLPQLYFSFREELLKNGRLYGGLLKRIVVENKEHIPNAYLKYFFVGFNALTKTERQLMLHFKKEAETYFYWDYDKFYLEDPLNEAGYFLRKNIELLGDDLKTDRNLIKKNKNIHIIGFPEETLQSKAIPKIFEKINLDFADIQQLKETIIILTREDVLLSVLSAIPEQIKEINITTGFHISNLPIYSLIENWLQALQYLQTKKSFNVENLILILKNPLIYNYLDPKDRDKINDLTQLKTAFINSTDIDFSSELLQILFDPQIFRQSEKFWDNFLRFLHYIFWLNENNSILAEFIYHLYQKITLLKNIFAEFSDIQVDLQRKFYLVRKILSNIQVPFTGKKIEGLQITTMLETRNLDFKNVIILNLNEENYPKTKKTPSFLSEFIRSIFQLPLIKAQDSVYAYFFYRLLQRSENIFLLYNNNIGEKTKEKSRFIQQIEFELPHLIKENSAYYDITIPQITVNQQAIKKDDFSKQILHKYKTERYFSASSLNTYLDCPAKFYFKYIANIKEPKIFKIELDRNLVGSVLHKTMELLYQFVIDKYSGFVDKKLLDILTDQLDNFINQAVEKELQSNPQYLKQGINTLILPIIKKQAQIILNYDKTIAPFQVISTEQKKKSEIDFGDFKIKIEAIIDRIHKKDDVYYLVDYKTGKDKNEAKFEDIFDPKKPETHAIFQMLLYTYLHLDENAVYKPQLYVIRQMQKVNFQPDIILQIKQLAENKIAVDTSEKAIFTDYFLPKFKQIIEKLFNSEEFEFAQSSVCNYCPYFYVCGKMV